METFRNSNPLFRIDPLTGAPNLLGFLDFLLNEFHQPDHPQQSLVSLDINRFSNVDRTRGDGILRWIAIDLAEQTRAPFFRIGGDEFVVVLRDGAHANHASLARSLFERLNAEAGRFDLTAPLATITVLHFTGEEEASPALVLEQLNAAMLEAKTRCQGTFEVFHSSRLPKTRHWIVENMIHRLVALGEMLDESLKLAYSDPLTGLPNMRAALQEMESATAHASAHGQAISVLLVDGDDLGRYNDISYAAGDAMIQRLSETLKSQLRPSDFIARWRMGDEFLIVLPHTPPDQALLVAERLCQKVHLASQEWPLPVTISVGVVGVGCGYESTTLGKNDLLLQVQNALERAKLGGKNRVEGISPLQRSAG